MSTDVLFYFFVNSIGEDALDFLFRAVSLHWAEALLVFAILALGVSPDVYVCLHLHHLAGSAVLAA